MIEPGQTLHNPVTKEWMTFLRTAAQTGGDHILIELRSEPGGFVAAAHTHPAQTETFEIVSGTFGAKVGRELVEARAGETLIVDPGTPHKWWNAGEDELVFRCEIRPAGQFEQLIETMFGLAAVGKTNRKGMPNPLRLAVIAKHHFADVQLPFPPPALQRLGLALGSPIGRLLGYQPVHVPAGTPAANPLEVAERREQSETVVLRQHPRRRRAHAGGRRLAHPGTARSVPDVSSAAEGRVT